MMIQTLKTVNGMEEIVVVLWTCQNVQFVNALNLVDGMIITVLNIGDLFVKKMVVQVSKLETSVRCSLFKNSAVAGESHQKSYYLRELEQTVQRLQTVWFFVMFGRFGVWFWPKKSCSEVFECAGRNKLK